jgi:hypothetical protein
MNGIETNDMEETWTHDNHNETHHAYEIGFTSLIEHADEVWPYAQILVTLHMFMDKMDHTNVFMNKVWQNGMNPCSWMKMTSLVHGWNLHS